MAHPQIAVFARLAEGAQEPVRRIEGQKTLLGRTMHAIHYNAVRDEIVVPQQFAQAILTFRGGARGEEPPIRVIQGSRTQLRGSSGVVIDTVNDELITEGLVFPIDANGNVPPIRTVGYEVVAVDPINDLYISIDDAEAGGAQLMIHDRQSDSPEPLRVISGPNTMLANSNQNRVRVHNGWILVSHDGVQIRNPTHQSFVGVWSIYDEGDVAPRWTIGGPNRMLIKPRGVEVDAKNQTVIVSDKTLNAVLTYHVPELFTESSGSAEVRPDAVGTAARDREPGRFQNLWRYVSHSLMRAPRGVAVE